MVSAIFSAGNTPRVVQRLANNRQPIANRDQDARATSTSSALQANQFSDLGFDPSSELQSYQSERLALKARSRTKIRVDDEGNLRATNRTKLQFRYDLETSDGQQISLRAKARIKQSVVQDENGDLAIQTKIKFQFRLIQQDVSEELNPVAQTAEDRLALGAFGDALDSAGVQFADQGAIDADELIGAVLDAFNELYERFSAGPRPSVASGTEPDTVADAPDEAIAQAVDRTQANVVDAVSVRVRLRSIAAVESTTETVTDAAAGGGEVSEPSETDVVSSDLSSDDVDEARDIEVDDERDDDDDERDDDDDVSASDRPSTAQTTDSENNESIDRGEALQRVRIRFVQSFSQVIESLSPSGESDAPIRVVQQQSSLRLKANISFLA